MKLLTFCLLLICLSTPAIAMERAFGFCQNGNQTVVTGGVSSVTKVQGSFPGCTVTVYESDGITLATIYSDNLPSPTPKSNPFIADGTTGFWFFYALNGTYRVQISGGGLAAPLIIGDILLFDPGTSTSSSGPTLVTTAFNFSAITPGGSLSPGSNTIALSACPPGVKGSNTDYAVYASGGTGTAEPMLVTGGTCTGTGSGTLIVTAANSHTGAWTLTSATQGAQEAEWSITSGPVTISYPYGDFTIHYPIRRRANIKMWIAGQGMSSTTLNVASDFPLTANGLFDWTPQDSTGTSEGGAHDLSIHFIQPDSAAGCPGSCNISATYTHWPPAIYTSGTYHTEWTNMMITAAWKFADIPTNTNGAQFYNIYGSVFFRGISVDQSFDTVRIENYHVTTTGLTSNQITAFLAQGSNIKPLYIGRVDDLKITNTTIGTPSQCMDIHAGSDSSGPDGKVSNLWCEGPIQMSQGIIELTGYTGASGGSLPGIQLTGGQLLMSNSWMIYVGSAQAILAQAFRGTVTTGGSAYPPSFQMSNSRIDTQTVDGASTIFCGTAAPYTDRMDCKLVNNLIYRVPAIAYTNPIVIGAQGTGDTHLTMTGNTFIGPANAAAVGVLLDTDTEHNITGNAMGGYGFTMPATIANIVWNANSNVRGNYDTSARSAFANLPASPDGTSLFCTNCNPATSPCTTGGAGAAAMRQGGAWKCF